MDLNSIFAGVTETLKIVQQNYPGRHQGVYDYEAPVAQHVTSPPEITLGTPITSTALSTPRSMDPIIDQLPKLQTKKLGFRLRGRRFMLTYRCWWNKEFIKWFLSEYAKNHKGGTLTEIYICHETGHGNTPYHHTHVAVEFSSSLDDHTNRAGRMWDIEWNYLFNPQCCVRYVESEFVSKKTGLPKGIRCNIHPNIKNVKSALHWKRILNYICKEDEDTRKEVLEKHPTIETDSASVYERIENCNTVNDLMKSVTSYGDVQGALAAYDRILDLNKDVIPPELKHPWQHKFIEMLNDISLFNRRLIVWIYDPKGGWGKSELGAYLDLTQPNNWLFIDRTGSPSDFAEIVKSRREGGWTGEGLLLDLPRDAEKHSFYTALEAHCSNKVTCTKWKGKPLYINKRGFDKSTPGNKTGVFANFLPQIVGRQSVDRWRIFKITDTGDLEGPMDVWEIHRAQQLNPDPYSPFVMHTTGQTAQDFHPVGFFNAVQ